jgi:hypothetical protein
MVACDGWCNVVLFVRGHVFAGNSLRFTLHLLAFFVIGVRACPGEELPQISVARDLNAVRISWPASATNFVLESTPDLRPGWQPIYDLNTNLLVLPSPALSLEAFRLRKGIRIDATMPSVPVGQTGIINEQSANIAEFSAS